MTEEENELKILVDLIDSKITEWCLLYKISPLSLIATVLARLALFAKSLGAVDDFIQLLDHVKETVKKDNAEKVVH